MDLTFNFFKYLYPEKTPTRNLTTEELAFAQQQLPETLYHFLKEEGYCTYGGFFRFVDHREHENILAQWTEIPQGHIVFLTTAMGDIFTWYQDDVWILHVNQASMSNISDNMSDFFKFCLGDEKYVGKTLFKKQFDEVHKKLGPVQPQECYAFTQPGKFTSNTIEKTNMAEYLDMLAKVNAGIFRMNP